MAGDGSPGYVVRVTGREERKGKWNARTTERGFWVESLVKGASRRFENFPCPLFSLPPQALRAVVRSLNQLCSAENKLS